MEKQGHNPQQDSGKNRMRDWEDLMRDVDNFFKQVADKVLRMDLDELAEIYEKKINALILKKEREELLRYIGGQFTIACVTEKEFSLKLTLYFQNEQKEWVKLEPKDVIRNMKYLKAEAAAELQKKQQIVYDIDHPNANQAEEKPDNGAAE